MVPQPPLAAVYFDNKVAVVKTNCEGAGWYTFNSGCTGLLFDPELVLAVQAGDTVSVYRRAIELYPHRYYGAFASLEVAYVPRGIVCSIHQVRGHEFISTVDMTGLLFST